MNFSLFDVEDNTTTPHVRDMNIGPVTTNDVREFSRRYHYMASTTGNAYSWRWGLWSGPELHGVVAYNLPTISTCESVFGKEHSAHVWHMCRLIAADRSPRNTESRLIGLSLQEIQRNHPDVWAVITYADTTVGHIGTIYQATNAHYIGVGGKTNYYLDQDGRRRVLYQDGKTTDYIAAGWTRHQGTGKHRYLYILGSKTQRRQRRELLRYPILPYPKQQQPGDDL
jgi:hypothetical protein